MFQNRKPVPEGNRLSSENFGCHFNVMCDRAHHFVVKGEKMVAVWSPECSMYTE